MFVAERHERIRSILIKKRHIEVAVLGAMLGVSEGTIRRDLDKLEHQGFLTKTHGGAVLNDRIDEPPLPSDDTESMLADDYRAVSKVAACLVQNNDAIFVAGGAIAVNLAQQLKDRQRLTIMTNDLEVGRQLSGCAGVRLIITGGNVLQAAYVMVGPLAERSLEGVFVDRAFICVRGVDLVHGYTVDMPEEAEFLRAVMRVAKETVVMAVCTQFDRVGFAPLCELGAIQKLVSNKEVPDTYKQFLFQQNVQVFTTYDIE